MRTREPWVHFSFSPSPIYLYRAMVRAVSPRSVAHMVAQCRFRPRAGPGAASGRPCRVWRLRRSCALYALRPCGVGTLCFAVRFLHLRVTNPVNLCEVFSWARDGLGGSGAFLCAHRAVGEDPTSGTSTHYFHTRTPPTRRAAARPPLSDICRSASQIGEAKSFPYVVQHWV